MSDDETPATSIVCEKCEQQKIIDEAVAEFYNSGDIVQKQIEATITLFANKHHNIAFTCDGACGTVGVRAKVYSDGPPPHGRIHEVLLPAGWIRVQYRDGSKTDSYDFCAACQKDPSTTPPGELMGRVTRFSMINM